MAGIYNTEDLEHQVFSDEPEMPEDFPALEITLILVDGQELVCEAVGIFGSEAAQYMVLHPKENTDGLIYLLRMAQGDEDKLLLLPIENDEERMEAEREFHRMFI